MFSSSAVKSSVVGTTNLFSESVDTGHVLKWSLISVYGNAPFRQGEHSRRQTSNRAPPSIVLNSLIERGSVCYIGLLLMHCDSSSEVFKWWRLLIQVNIILLILCKRWWSWKWQLFWFERRKYNFFRLWSGGASSSTLHYYLRSG
jgi:hypothetical protein